MSLRSRIVDGVFGVLEGAAALYDFVRGLQRRITRDTDPIPLIRNSSGREFSGVDSGRYTSRLADAKPRPLTDQIPKPPRVPRDLR